MAFALSRIQESLLLMVDLQEGLFRAMPKEEGARMVATVRMLVQAAARLGIPVVVTEQYPKGLGPTLPEIGELLPPGSRRFEKRVFSALKRAELRELLLTLPNRRQVIVVGMEAHVCILQTVADLLDGGWIPFVVADGICSRDPERKLYALDRMERGGAVITCGESVVFEWLESADHPRFKEIVALIR